MLAGSAHAQITGPVVLAANDPTVASGASDIYVYDLASGAFTTSINADLRITGLAYDQVAHRVYIMVRSSTSTTQSQLWTLDVSPTNPAVGPTLVNNVSNPTNVTSGGAAWDNVNGRLITTFQGRLFSVDLATASLTQLRDFGNSAQISGADFDPVSGALYIVQNSTGATQITGRGIYRIDPPIESGNVTKVADFPIKPGGSALETDIDGLAVAGSTLYLTTDEVVTMYRYDLKTGTYLSNIDQPFTGTGAAVGGATFIATATSDADVGVSVRTDDNISAPANQITYVVDVRNVGGSAAGNVNVSVPIPAGTTFVSSTGGSTFSAGTVSFAAGSLASNAGASFTFTVANAANGSFPVTATATTSSTDAWSGNNTGGITAVRPTSSDLSVTVAGPTNCAVAPGNIANYTFTVTNSGGQATSGVTLTVPIPANASFSSSTPPASIVSGNAIITIGELQAGQSVTVPVGLAVTGGTTLAASGTVASLSTDTNAANNTANTSFVVDNFSPATAAAKGIFTTIAGNANNSFDNSGLTFAGPVGLPSQGTPYLSSNRQWLVMAWELAATSTDGHSLIRKNLQTGVSDLVAREGVTVIPTVPSPTIAQNNFALMIGINDSGEVNFSGDTNGPTTEDNYVAKVSNGVVSLIAQEGQPTGTSFGNVWGSTLGSSKIANSGAVSFVGNIPALPTGQQEIAFLINGSQSTIQTGVSVPTDAGGTLNDIFNGSNSSGYFTAANGLDWIAHGTRPGSIEIAVVGSGPGAGTAVAEEGEVLPNSTFSVPVSTIESVHITPEGRWFVRGANSDGQAWVYSGATTSSPGTVLAKGGDPIFPGSTELWSFGTTSTNPFFGNTTNPRGDILIGGETNNPLINFNSVFVLNGQTVIARESDPVDANGDGMFNEDFYFRDLGIGDDRVQMSNDAIYFQARLRPKSAVCGGADPSTSEFGLFSVPLPAVAVSVCCRGTTCSLVAPGSCTAPAGVGVSSPAGAACNAGGSNTAPCCYSDFNKDGSRNIDDIFIYLNAWFNTASNPYTKIGGDGITPANIDDLFIFINVWFAGGCG
jgi:uncharacterized repeat protein (TIGR01451 family)